MSFLAHVVLARGFLQPVLFLFATELVHPALEGFRTVLNPSSVEPFPASLVWELGRQFIWLSETTGAVYEMSKQCLAADCLMCKIIVSLARG